MCHYKGLIPFFSELLFLLHSSFASYCTTQVPLPLDSRLLYRVSPLFEQVEIKWKTAMRRDLIFNSVTSLWWDPQHWKLIRGTHYWRCKERQHEAHYLDQVNQSRKHQHLMNLGHINTVYRATWISCPGSGKDCEYWSSMEIKYWAFAHLAETDGEKSESSFKQWE